MIVFRKTKFYETDCEELDETPIDELCRALPTCNKTNQTNMFCNYIRSMRFYLHAFSSTIGYPSDDVCLSFAFTFRNLDDFQGIAWIKARCQMGV